MKALAIGDEHAQGDALRRMKGLQVEQPLQGIRIAYLEVITGNEAQRSAADEMVLEMRVKSLHATRHHECDGDVHTRCSCEIALEQWPEGMVTAGDEELRMLGRRFAVSRRPRHAGRFGCGIGCRQVISLVRDDPANTAARVRNVPRVSWDDVKVQMSDGLAGIATDVHADVVPGRPISFVDLRSSNGDRRKELRAFLVRRIEPRRHAPRRDEQRVAVGHGKGIPQAQDEFAAVKDPVVGYGAKRARIHSA